MPFKVGGGLTLLGTGNIFIWGGVYWCGPPLAMGRKRSYPRNFSMGAIACVAPEMPLWLHFSAQGIPQV